ncbi:MAG: hypothetical protein LBF22_06865 [Deltaproteobacteria bacterium]|nr:hypothetical protein [Deltaproteobacteria bacterium]
MYSFGRLSFGGAAFLFVRYGHYPEDLCRSMRYTYFRAKIIRSCDGLRFG